MARPKESQIDASFLREEILKSIQELETNLKRYSRDQIAKSKTLTQRERRLKHLRGVLEKLLKAMGKEQEHMTKKQPTRMLLAGCIGCQYQVRLTRKWADLGMPLCGNDACENRGQPFEFIEARPYAFAYSQAQKEYEQEMTAANSERESDDEFFKSIGAGDLSGIGKE